MPTVKKPTTLPVETQVKGVKKVVATKVPVIKATEAVKPVQVVEKNDEQVKTEDVPVTTVTATQQENVLQTIIEKVNSFVAMGKEIQCQLKVLSKEWDKQQKIIDKITNKNRSSL